MDYEKKYKEALELARVAAFNGHQSLMEGIFPELAESEDEKIRKELIEFVKSRGGFKQEYIAWLEKQGEKSLTVDIESMIEAYEQRLINQGNGVRNSPIVNMCVAAFKHGVENTLDELHLKQGETSPILSNSSNIGKDEQKPAWSEKDKKEYKYVLKFVDNILNNCGNKKDYEHCKRCYDWLKSLRQRIGG